ncbi:hypothetical protein [Aeromicrobium sp. UC242_57]|uniref:hypothetical protein n=1 Tax=Aeromicrobium sp. UC242_57 TaxID=3374624 RepID=UPI0037C13D96
MAAFVLACSAAVASVTAPAEAKGRTYPLHTGIVATTFWVGEVFDPDAADGSQMISTYDDHWYRNYGGCDGRIVKRVCKTEKRLASNGYFPRTMKPKQNPFYLDLPYDDLNDRTGFRNRGRHLPWAKDAKYKPYIKDGRVSLMKDRWVRISRKGKVCYGQIQDAGPGEYHNAKYVFGKKNARPASKRYNNAGMDVSPALNSCLRFSSLNGQNDKVNWRFVEAKNVPNGPWKKIVTKTKWPKAR